MSMLMRCAKITRRTKETEISVEVDLDGTGKADIATGIGFFDHMLDQIARHSLIDLTIRAEGDLYIDMHHTVQDTALPLGHPIREAPGHTPPITHYPPLPL